MLNAHESTAWAEIERRLVRERRRAAWSVPVQTAVPLVLAVVCAVLAMPVPALLFAFLVPVGAVLHMTCNDPPRP